MALLWENKRHFLKIRAFFSPDQWKKLMDFKCIEQMDNKPMSPIMVTSKILVLLQNGT